VEVIDVKKAFGTAIRKWRNDLRLSQEELAERTDLHRTYISSIERGVRNVSLENINKLAQALETSVCELFPAGEQKAAKTAHCPGGKNENDAVDVLLIEDNPDDAAMTLDAFKTARFKNRVTVIADGAQALDYFFCRGRYSDRRPSDQPQIVLLDLNLPKVSGLEVLRRIKADKRTQSMRVIILTISGKNSDIMECRRLGAETYITKPVTFQNLSRATPQLNLDWLLMQPPARESHKFRSLNSS